MNNGQFGTNIVQHRVQQPWLLCKYKEGPGSWIFHAGCPSRTDWSLFDCERQSSKCAGNILFWDINVIIKHYCSAFTFGNFVFLNSNVREPSHVYIQKFCRGSLASFSMPGWQARMGYLWKSVSWPLGFSSILWHAFVVNGKFCFLCA